MTKEYICECGRKFDKPQSFNGHKSNCIIHLEKTGKLVARQCSRSIGAMKTGAITAERAAKRRNEALIAWLLASHTCETCGKVMTEKFGSGRFCSRACANSRKHSDESIEHIRQSLLSYNSQIANAQPRHIQCKAIYNGHPRSCVVCGNIIPYERRDCETCSDICYHTRLSQLIKQCVVKAGGNLNPKGPGASKYGTYRGFHCDSSWELAFVIYNLDHNIPFQRNYDSFSYLYNGAEHKYYPDFIVDNAYIEIKNYDSPRNQAKRNQFPADKVLKTLFRKDIQPYLDYCTVKYGNDFYTLYDQDKPSWMNKNTEV